jgi:hypothetical protein
MKKITMMMLMMLLLDLRPGRSSLFPPSPKFSFCLSSLLYLFLVFLFRRFFAPVRDPYPYGLAVRVFELHTPLI